MDKGYIYNEACNWTQITLDIFTSQAVYSFLGQLTDGQNDRWPDEISWCIVGAGYVTATVHNNSQVRQPGDVITGCHSDRLTSSTATDDSPCM